MLRKLLPEYIDQRMVCDCKVQAKVYLIPQNNGFLHRLEQNVARKPSFARDFRQKSEQRVKITCSEATKK
jgi:hypothetical protein